MGLLKSVDNVPGINFYDYRDDNYYNKYEFRMRVKVPCVRYTWYCKKPEDLDTKIQGRFKGYGNIRKSDLQTVIDNLAALKAIIIIQTTRKKHNDLGVRIESGTVAIFSNDLSVLHDLAPLIGTQYSYDYTQVQTSQYAGVKHFVEEPKHKYRVYLRSKRVEDNFHVELTSMLARQKELYPSNALKEWLKRDPKRWGIWSFRYLSSAHFIDYDDESTLSYLALMHGEVLGKKYKLEKRPDIV
jgi:uncharacterized protein YeaO (DUF488 family)